MANAPLSSQSSSDASLKNASPKQTQSQNLAQESLAKDLNHPNQPLNQPELSSRMAIEPGVEIDLEDEDEFEGGGFPWLLVTGAIALVLATGGGAVVATVPGGGGSGSLDGESGKTGGGGVRCPCAIGDGGGYVGFCGDVAGGESGDVSGGDGGADCAHFDAIRAAHSTKSAVVSN